MSGDGSTVDDRWKRAMDCFSGGDRQGALYLYRSLAEDGEDLALVEVGNIYELGYQQIMGDYHEAAKWYRKAIFAIDDAKAHLGLARMYFNRDIDSQDSAEAFIRHASVAASKHEPLAFLMLGIAYQVGYLAVRDGQKAKSYFEQAAAHGMVVARRELCRFALKEKRYLEAIKMYSSLVRDVICISIRNPRDPRLGGIRANERRLSTQKD